MNINTHRPCCLFRFKPCWGTSAKEGNKTDSAPDSLTRLQRSMPLGPSSLLFFCPRVSTETPPTAVPGFLSVRRFSSTYRSVFGPSAWNDLPLPFRQKPCLDSLKCTLKTLERASQSSGTVWRWRWPSWAVVSIDIHINICIDIWMYVH